MTRGYNSRFIRRHGEKFGLQGFNKPQGEPGDNQPIAAPHSRETERYDELKKFAEMKTVGELRAACPFAKHIQDYLDDKLSDERSRNFIEKLYKKYFEGDSLEVNFFNLMFFDRILMKIHLSRKPDDVEMDDYPCSGDLLDAIIIRILNGRAITESDAEEIIDLEKDLRTRGASKVAMGFLTVIETRMAHIMYSQKIARTFAEQWNTEGFHVEKERQEYRKLANDIFTGMKALRRYSIASSMYEDGVSHGPGKAWVIMNPVPLRRANDVLEKSFRHTLAALLLCTDSSAITDISANPRMDDSSQLHLQRIDYSFPYDYRYDFGDDGEIYLCMHPFKLPLKDICTRMGCPGVYEFLRFLLVAHLFDMVVPVEVSEQAPSLHRLRERIQREQQETGESPDVIIRRLVLPRKHIVRDTEKLQKAIDDSNDEGHAEVERRLGRKIEHRIGSPMRLREGCKRHPLAVQWALEHGITLKDNETWRQPTDSENPLQKIIYSSKKDLKKTLLTHDG